jgi:hypothetical protein
MSNWVKDFFFFGNQDMMIYLMKNFIDKIYTDIDCLCSNNLNISPEIQLATFVNTDTNLKNKLKQIKIIDSCFYHIGMYRSGYYLGKKENIEKYLRIRK